MKEIIEVMEKLLTAYERSTPSIDQDLVRKALKVIQSARILVAAGLALLIMVSPARAWDTRENPDRYLSVGMDVSTGKLAGMLTTVPAGAPATDGGFVKGALDIRMPLSNAVTVHAFGSSTGINNNLQFSGGNEAGIGLRVYFHD